MTTKSSPEPTCPLCSGTIHQGDRVVYSHGDLVHVACDTEAGGAEESVASLLKGSPGRRYCHTCLARSLSLAWSDAAKAVSRLRVTAAFAVTTGRCSMCGQLRVTIAAN
jgi:hypothetical protein